MVSRHKEIYFSFFGYCEGDFIASEVSGKPAVDIHAIIPDGRGGRKVDPPIEILIALTRQEHEKWGHGIQYRPWLLFRHLNVLVQKFPAYEIKEEYRHFLYPSPEDFNLWLTYKI